MPSKEAELCALRGRLLYAFALLALALFASNGGLGPIALPLALASAVLVALAAARGPDRLTLLDAQRIIAVLLLVEGALAWTKPLGVYVHGYALIARLCITAASLIAAATVVRPRRSELMLAISIALFVGASVLVLCASPSPAIDVFSLQQEGARALFSGVDPYRETYSNPYDAEQTLTFFGAPLTRLGHYPYPPLSLLLTALSWKVLGDVRVVLLAAQIACVVGVAARCRQARLQPGLGEGIATLLLLHPRALFVLEQSWTEPLLAAAFVWLLCAITAGARPAIVIAASAAFFSAKQYSALLLPMLASTRFVGVRRRYVWWGLGLAIVLVLPFFFWDPPAFIDDLVMFQVRQPFRWGALSIAPVIAFLSGYQPSMLSPIAAVIVAALLWRRVRGIDGFCITTAALLFAFFVTAKQAFCNYYYFVGVAILCAAILSDDPSRAAT